MPSCIVCHLEINISGDSYFECDNGHPIHSKCLTQWIMHSQNCPLCSDPYPRNVLAMFEEYMEYKEREKQEALEDKQKEEAAEKMKQVANNIVFLKYIDSIEKLINDENYTVALDLLMESYNENATDDKDLKILFLLGKLNYLRGRYDLAINFLFKLVKVKFDYPDGFFFLGRAYEALGMKDKADWAYKRVK
ncbi:MAG: hypothetical protein ACXAAI_10050 [Promethearchaeota archaeon]